MLYGKGTMSPYIIVVSAGVSIPSLDPRNQTSHPPLCQPDNNVIVNIFCKRSTLIQQQGHDIVLYSSAEEETQGLNIDGIWLN
jgi:hypothetical protein